ncbi:hypothetical protein [Paraburkholderia sp. GAS333]|uniref:hypothetical protein n=1 Tax=Paraburkholderia sp. GAS333 TaxID=3156279 RepID=UPI003D19EEF4
MDAFIDCLIYLDVPAAEMTTVRVSQNETLEIQGGAGRKVVAVYKTLDGWIADPDCAYWYGREGDTRYIWASAEPGGLLFCGRVESSLWSGWLTVLCARLSLVLGREVHDAEM